jgi:hypothetical protein
VSRRILLEVGAAGQPFVEIPDCRKVSKSGTLRRGPGTLVETHPKEAVMSLLSEPASATLRLRASRQGRRALNAVVTGLATAIGNAIVVWAVWWLRK